MAHALPHALPRDRQPQDGSAADAGACLGRTCMKWSPNGELADLDFQLILARLGAVDAALGEALAGPPPGPAEPAGPADS